MSSLSSVEEFVRIHTGEANAERPHLAVPLYMPLCPTIVRADVVRRLPESLQSGVADGSVELIAIAHGAMCKGNCCDPLQPTKGSRRLVERRIWQTSSFRLCFGDFRGFFRLGKKSCFTFRRRSVYSCGRRAFRQQSG